MPDEQNITHSYIIDFVRENLKKSEAFYMSLKILRIKTKCR